MLLGTSEDDLLGNRMNSDLMEFVVETICLKKMMGCMLYILMSMILELVGFLYIFQTMMLFILAVLELNTFLKRFKNLLEIKS